MSVHHGLALIDAFHNAFIRIFRKYVNCLGITVHGNDSGNPQKQWPCKYEEAHNNTQAPDFQTISGIGKQIVDACRLPVDDTQSICGKAHIEKSGYQSGNEGQQDGRYHHSCVNSGCSIRIWYQSGKNTGNTGHHGNNKTDCRENYHVNKGNKYGMGISLLHGSFGIHFQLHTIHIKYPPQKECNLVFWNMEVL